MQYLEKRVGSAERCSHLVQMCGGTSRVHTPAGTVLCVMEHMEELGIAEECDQLPERF